MIAADFFCGGGGMTKGLSLAGIDVQFGLDFNPYCQETYEENNHIPYLCRDITEITGAELIEQFPVLLQNDELILVGCAPCQPFSKQRHSETEHVAVNLLDEFGRIIDEILPGYVLVENVPGIQNRGHEVFERFLRRLGDLGYEVIYDVLNAKNYGVPQNRNRLVLIASRLNVPALPLPTHGPNLQEYATVYEAIHHYPDIAAGETNVAVANHRAAGISDLNMRRLQATPIDGGGREDWPDELKLVCHTNGHKGHTDVYGRMAWDKVSPTLTSKCFSVSNGRFAHPVQNRAISLREAAAIQSFPDDYIFYGNLQEVGKQIGNAVPVLLAQRIGECIIENYNQYLRQYEVND